MKQNDCGYNVPSSSCVPVPVYLPNVMICIIATGAVLSY